MFFKYMGKYAVLNLLLYFKINEAKVLGTSSCPKQEVLWHCDKRDFLTHYHSETLWSLTQGWK